MPWAIMDQAVGLPALNGCFIDGTFFVANHLNGKHRIDGADKAETAGDVTKRIIANPKSPITMDGVLDKIGGADPLISKRRYRFKGKT